VSPTRRPSWLIWLGALVREDETAKRGLASWMTDAATPVLRVNAAGVLAGAPQVGDTVITQLRVDRDARQLYLTAVASRVLGAPWDQAGYLVGGLDDHADSLSEPLPDGQGVWAVQRLAG
jgi:hypothetical protein